MPSRVRQTMRPVSWRAVLVCAVGFACTSPPPEAIRQVEAAEVAVDPVLIAEVAPLTASLIRARAENPPGNERRVVDALLERLGRLGLGRMKVDVAPFEGEDRVNLRIDLVGTDVALAPIVLMAHADVVPAEEGAWSYPPWEGVADGEVLVGRGAVDMLGTAALQALTMVALERMSSPLQRTVTFLLVGDEEVEGKGIRAALERWPELAHAFAVLTEGSFLLQGYLREGEDLAPIAVAEKGLFQVRLEAHGASGHGSTPIDDAAPDRLVRAVSRILRAERSFILTAPVRQHLAGLGRRRGGIEGHVLQSDALVGIVAKRVMMATPTTRALVTDTCALTILEAGEKVNVVPGGASATFDCRLLPGTDPARFHEALAGTVDDPQVAIHVVQTSPATGSDPDHPVVHALRARLERELPSLVVTTTLTKGATDCRFLRAAGAPCYGLSPIRLTAEELDALHGANERVRLRELEKGLSRFVDVVATLAVARRSS